MVTARELLLILSNIAWIYSYTQWCIFKILPVFYLLYTSVGKDVTMLYFGLTMFGDIFLHGDFVRLGVFFFYLSHLILIMYVLAKKDHGNRINIFMGVLLAFLPGIWSTVYSFFIYALLTIYALALIIPYSTKDGAFLGEALLLMACSDVMVLVQYLGVASIQPISLTFYYIAQYLIAQSNLVLPHTTVKSDDL